MPRHEISARVGLLDSCQERIFWIKRKYEKHCLEICKLKKRWTNLPVIYRWSKLLYLVWSVQLGVWWLVDRFYNPRLTWSLVRYSLCLVLKIRLIGLEKRKNVRRGGKRRKQRVSFRTFEARHRLHRERPFDDGSVQVKNQRKKMHGNIQAILLNQDTGFVEIGYQLEPSWYYQHNGRKVNKKDAKRASLMRLFDKKLFVVCSRSNNWVVRQTQTIQNFKRSPA